MFVLIVVCYGRGDHRARAVDLIQGIRIGQSWDPRCRAVVRSAQSLWACALFELLLSLLLGTRTGRSSGAKNRVEALGVLFPLSLP